MPGKLPSKAQWRKWRKAQRPDWPPTPPASYSYTVHQSRRKLKRQPPEGR